MRICRIYSASGYCFLYLKPPLSFFEGYERAAACSTICGDITYILDLVVAGKTNDRTLDPTQSFGQQSAELKVFHRVRLVDVLTSVNYYLSDTVLATELRYAPEVPPDARPACKYVFRKLVDYIEDGRRGSRSFCSK